MTKTAYFSFHTIPKKTIKNSQLNLSISGYSRRESGYDKRVKIVKYILYIFASLVLICLGIKKTHIVLSCVGILAKKTNSWRFQDSVFKASALWANALYKSITPSVCPCVCSFLVYHLNVFLHQLPEVGCQIFLKI